MQLPRPIAIQWGGQVFVTDATKRARFALASALSSVCRHLDVEIVRDWNIGQTEYWGAVGHYKIGFTACGLVVNKDLKQLMLANQDRIAQSPTPGCLPRTKNRSPAINSCRWPTSPI